MAMEDSKPTCFVSFEMPLTVTFIVETGSGLNDWSDSGEEQDDSEHHGTSKLTSKLTGTGIFTKRPKSLSVSTISDNMQHINSFSTTDEYFEWENSVEFTEDQIVCESSDYKRGMMEDVNISCLYKSVEHSSDEKMFDENEGEDVVFYSSQNDSFEHRFYIGTDDCDCSHVDDFLGVDSLESCLRRHDQVPESRAEGEKEASLSDSSDNLDVCLSTNLKNDFPSADDCDDFAQEVAVTVLCDGINSITHAASPKGSQPRDFQENDDSFLSQFSCCSNGDILPLTEEHSDTAGHGNDDLKLKTEKVQTDLGYFTEEGNEGGKDEEECSNSVRGASGSGGLSNVRTSSDDKCCCCGEIQTYHNTKSQLGRSKSSTLEHSRTAFSFDVSASSASPNDSSAWTDHCRFFPISVPAKSVTFPDYPIPVHKWHFAADSDGSQAMEKLKAVANHLCLPVNREKAKKEELTENCSQPATNQRKKSSVSVNIDSLETNDHHAYPAMAYDSINEFIAQMKHELFQLRKADDAIAAKMLFLYGEIKQYKYVHNCHLYREMMEAAIDNEDKKDELSRHHVDTIPERLCATFKHWGLTRINLQRRRFSIF